MISILLVLVSCGMSHNSDSTSSNDIKYRNLTTTKSLQQKTANQAKKALSDNNDITSVNAVNTSKDIIIAFEVSHLKRFSLKKVRAKIQKEMENEFPDLDVVVSTDKKIIIELNKLEEKLSSDSISKKELNKKVKELVALAKEQT